MKTLFDIYKESSKYVEGMITAVIWIGRGNLYVGTGEYSHATLGYTLDVLDIMAEKELSIPELSRFERSQFSEWHGWGLAHDRSFFNKHNGF